MEASAARLGLAPERLGLRSPSGLLTVVIVPAYKASQTVVDVVQKCLNFADSVIVVDDACPERSGEVVSDAFAYDARVTVKWRKQNGGVGAAMKTGIEVALGDQADVIVKIDADGQMDPSYIPMIRQAFAQDASLVCVKGNRFFRSEVLHKMPKLRLIGNGVLSLLAKAASGYWNAIDPTNGYLALNGGLLRVLPWQSFDDSYFFELSVLCELGLRRLPILELEMPTRYDGAVSSLSIARVIRQFPRKLLQRTFRRLMQQYFVFDVNLGTVYLLTGFALALFGFVFGSYEWAEGIITNTARPVGTIMLAALPFMMGFQLLLNALMYDVQFCQRTRQELLVDTRSRSYDAIAGTSRQ